MDAYIWMTGIFVYLLMISLDLNSRETKTVCMLRSYATICTTGRTCRNSERSWAIFPTLPGWRLYDTSLCSCSSVSLPCLQAFHELSYELTGKASEKENSIWIWKYENSIWIWKLSENNFIQLKASLRTLIWICWSDFSVYLMEKEGFLQRQIWQHLFLNCGILYSTIFFLLVGGFLFLNDDLAILNDSFRMNNLLLRLQSDDWLFHNIYQFWLNTKIIYYSIKLS